MVKCTPVMHVNLVIILEMCDKGWNVTYNKALRPSIRTSVRTKSAVLLMLKLAVVWKNIMAS
uniref:Uncharacterized protein MANES_09G037200 n=1 Tax=Rhizophora mucronata TaxID=61149 RepID=A0A2P2M2D2_RHIMU